MAAKIEVVGNGYMGTMVVACFARIDDGVVGLEVDPVKLSRLRCGQAPFFEAALEDLLGEGSGHRRRAERPSMLGVPRLSSTLGGING